MRSALLVATLLAASLGTARADTGGYFLEEFGAGGFHGELDRYDGGSNLRVHIGAGVRRGDRFYEFYGGAMGSIAEPDCFDCGPSRSATLGFLAFDVGRRFRLLYIRDFERVGQTYQRPGLNFTVAGGPRWYWGSENLSAAGPGLGAMVGLELNLWAIGFSMKGGLDVTHIRGEGVDARGTIPCFMFGVKLGWL